MNTPENHPNGQPLDLVSTEGLGLLVNRALFADECQRLAEWALIGPVQRAALESFAERLLAAERERCAKLCEQWDATNPQRLAALIRAGA